MAPAIAKLGRVTYRSDHFDGRRFFNPNGANGQPFWKVPRMLLARRTRWPSTISVAQHRPTDPAPDDVIVTHIGHAMLLIQLAGVNLLTDPVYSERASPFSFAGPRRVRAPAVRFDDLPTISLDRIVLAEKFYTDHGSPVAECRVRYRGRRR